MIAVVTQLSINRTKTDSGNLTQTVDEYLNEMNYQLELQLYNYIHFPATTQDTVIAGIQSFVTSFSQYASKKGIDANINLRLNEFSLVANKSTVTPTAVTVFPYSVTFYITLNSSILFQSSNSGSKVSGVFIHYFGFNVNIASATSNLVLTQKDFYGNTLKYIAGATFTLPAGVIDDNNGQYTGTFSGSPLNITLPSGLEFLS